MADRPILFSAPMVRALIDGRKTQTRRLLPHPEYYGCPTGDCPHDRQEQCNQAMIESTAEDLRFAVGDRLYVREEYYQFGSWHVVEGALTKGGKAKWAFDGAKAMVTFEPPADFLVSRDKAFPGLPRWYKRLGRFMPRSLSRMTLTVTDVRVQRLQDCSEADALAEGVVEYEPTMEDPAEFSAFDGTDVFNNAISAYHDLWNRINGAGAWEANPWVVAVTFEVREGNIDG
ncbi:hypothetical protein SAMIE_1015200 [Sphingobium amiense]|uniref:ASCH domain-containing protein n=1 Tax=Sphingobium amiense TaxID=135719 RepID=A0A494WCJ5_9SPHN|nr:hypothetical protein [Sphingobium amiense]BBD98019.1 hypothetical protein SAMIE_1015200 [Sphingobium amiense]